MSRRARHNPAVVRVVYMTLLVLLALGVGAWLVHRSGHPTAIVARITGLPVGRGHLTRFEQHVSKTPPDALTSADMQFAPAAFDTLIAVAASHGYTWLTPADSDYLAVTSVAGKTGRALYRIRGDIEKGSFNIVVLVPERHELYLRELAR